MTDNRGDLQGQRSKVKLGRWHLLYSRIHKNFRLRHNAISGEIDLNSAERLDDVNIAVTVLTVCDIRSRMFNYL